MRASVQRVRRGIHAGGSGGGGGGGGFAGFGRGVAGGGLGMARIGGGVRPSIRQSDRSGRASEGGPARINSTVAGSSSR